MPAQSFSGVAGIASSRPLQFFNCLRAPVLGDDRHLHVARGGPAPRVYVGNLAESVTRGALRSLFSKIGQVGGALVITDKLTGKTRGVDFGKKRGVEGVVNAAVFFSGVEL